MRTSFGWEGRGRYGSFRYRMNAGWAGKTEIPWERVLYQSTVEVCSWRGTIQIHVYLYPCQREVRSLVILLDSWGTVAQRSLLQSCCLGSKSMWFFSAFPSMSTTCLNTSFRDRTDSNLQRCVPLCHVYCVTCSCRGRACQASLSITTCGRPPTATFNRSACYS